MLTNRFQNLCPIISLFFILSITANSLGQIGLRTPQPLIYDDKPDSLNIFFPKPVLPLRDWQDLSFQYMELRSKSTKLDISRYISPGYISDNPFLIDTRESSIYVPRSVRDELNLIMNRPKDTAFAPILPVAFLVLQMAGKYLLIRSKTKISYADIEAAKEAVPVMEVLWLKNPQSISDLYKHDQISENMTMRKLQIYIEILIDNKLIRPKEIEQGETLYFPALNKKTYNEIVEKEQYGQKNKSESHVIKKGLIEIEN